MNIYDNHLYIYIYAYVYICQYLSIFIYLYLCIYGFIFKAISRFICSYIQKNWEEGTEFVFFSYLPSLKTPMPPTSEILSWPPVGRKLVGNSDKDLSVFCKHVSLIAGCSLCDVCGPQLLSPLVWRCTLGVLPHRGSCKWHRSEHMCAFVFWA